MLKNRLPAYGGEKLLVGNDSLDDAAVYDIGGGRAVISTTDFFMPIVDDPFDFGRIASANALSDIYAMGGTPIMAIAILGWPVDKLPAEVAGAVLEGAHHVCRQTGIPLAGGHSIDNPEPLFGLAPTGIVNTGRLKTNSGARPGDLLFLTKPLGIGVLSTAQKKGMLKAEHKDIARNLMVQLNQIGEELGQHAWVHSLTDVTGFGLLGHLLEICNASGTGAQLHMADIPIMEAARGYLSQGKQAVPGGTHRNWESFGDQISLEEEAWRYALCDPQTSGGLLIAVDPDHLNEFHHLMDSNGFGYITASPLGRITGRSPEDSSPKIEVVGGPFEDY